MDLVDSVTQNSNNRNVTMENRGASESDFWGGGVAESPQADVGQQGRDDDATGSTLLMSAATDLTTDQPGGRAPRAAPGLAPFNGQLAQLERQAGRAQIPEYLRVIGMDPKKFWPKQYRFTREKTPGQHQPLTVAQRNFYEHNGYIIFDDCLPRKSLELVRKQFKESRLIDEYLLERLLTRSNKLLQYIECFCDERLMLMTHRLVESFHTDEMVQEVLDQKQVSRQQLFRDWLYLPFRPIDRVCCAITAIEPLQNVVLLVPGTHRVGQCTISSPVDSAAASYSGNPAGCGGGETREVFEVAPDKLSTLVSKSEKGFKYANLAPGQTLVYHPGLVHGFSTDLVNSQRSQLALVAYYAAADCEFVDLRKSAAESLAHEQVPISLAHFGQRHPSDYTSWLDRPVLLKNSRASL